MSVACSSSCSLRLPHCPAARAEQVSRTTFGLHVSYRLPPEHLPHRGDVVSLHHYKYKSLEEVVQRRMFGRRPNTPFTDPPKDLNDTQVLAYPL